MKQGEFAARLKVPQSLVSQVEGGRQRASLDFLQTLQHAFGISIDWLLTGEGDPYLSREPTERIAETPGAYEIPVVTHASANPFANVEWDTLEYETISIDRRTRCVRVKDTSMLPVVRPGQCLFISPEESVRDGDLAIIKIKRGPGPLFKRVYYRREAREYTLESVDQADPKPPIYIHQDRIEYMFKVVGAWYE